jgi:branched-chain amino acid transport system permease protein
VLGGLGSLTGALLGAALLTFLPQAVTSVGVDLGLSAVQSAELAPLVYGVVMMLVILLAPAGLVGSLLGWWRQRRERPVGEQPDAQPRRAAPSADASTVH